MSKPLKRIRLTVPEAAAELKIAPETLSSRIKTGDITPGPDGKYSLIQIFTAKCGDLHGAKLRKATAEARMAERRDQREAQELVPTDWLEQFITEFAVHVRSLIWREARLPEALRRDMLDSLADSADRFLAQKFEDEHEHEHTDPEIDDSPTAPPRTRQARRRAGESAPAKDRGGAGAPPDATAGVLRRDAAGGGEAEPA